MAKAIPNERDEYKLNEPSMASYMGGLSLFQGVVGLTGVGGGAGVS